MTFRCNLFIDWPLAAAIVVAAGVMLIMGCDEAPRAGARQNAAAADAVEWLEGLRYAYNVQLSSRADVGQGGRDVVFELDGVLGLSVVRSDGPAVEMYGSFSEANLRTRGEAGKKEVQSLKASLYKPFFFQLEDGRVTGHRGVPDLTPFAENIWRTVTAGLQFPKSPSSQQEWIAREQDATGEYVVRYSKGNRAGRFLKVKQRYEPVSIPVALDTAEPKEMTPEIVTSKGSMLIEQGSLREIRQREKLRLNVGAGAPIESETALVLALDDASKPKKVPDYQELRRRTRKLDETGMSVTQRVNPRFDPERIGDYTFETALQELEALEAESADQPAGQRASDQATRAHQDEERQKKYFKTRSAAFIALTAIFRQQSKALSRAVDEVRSGSPARDVLLDAMASSGSEPAQQELVTLATDARQKRGLRQSAAYALARAHVPARATTDALLAHLDDPVIGVHALYGLGTMARELREEGLVGRSDGICRAIVERLDAVSSSSAKVHVLRGIANSGYAPALPKVLPLLQSQDKSLRAAAVEAVRLMDAGPVDGLIAERLTEDDETLVRLAALNAIKTRSPSETLSQALARAVRQDPNAAVRYQAVRLSAGWLDSLPALRSTLERVAEVDAREFVRRAARSVLGS